MSVAAATVCAHDGFTLFVNPTPFLHDGAAWVVMDHKPREGEFGEQWVEVLASAAHAAREEYLGSAP